MNRPFFVGAVTAMTKAKDSYADAEAALVFILTLCTRIATRLELE